MLLGSMVAFCWKPSTGVMASTQFFSAGIILAAVGMELLPKVPCNYHHTALTHPPTDDPDC